MKFKLSADPEDYLIFVIFAIFLLYVVAIGVVNFSWFASHGTLYGLNPLLAFTPRYLAATLLFYFGALVGIIVSCKSYFFEREEGIGFSTEKKSKGYSRWAKDKEIAEEDKVEMVNIKSQSSTVAGVPLIVKNDDIWVDNGDYHTLVIGSTGSGKTQDIVFPTIQILAKNKESMILTDPKGELYEGTSEMLRSRGYQILLLNFRDPQNGSGWNPLSLPYLMYKNGNQDKAIELLDDLALNILYDETNKNADPFWEKTSADYFAGVALGLFEDAKEEEININSISLMTTVGEEKFGGSTYIKEYFADKDQASAAVIDASSTIMAPTETKSSILSVFKQKVKLFASRDNLSEMLSHSDIDLTSIGKRPTAVFIVIQDEKKTYHSLVTILLKQIYETLIATAQENGGKLPIRTNFILDEFANMPPLKDVTTMITAARSRLIRFTMIIQNFAQLDEVYGKENSETLRGNCGNLIYLITTELKALEEISKMCGEVKSKKDDKTASTPLVTVSDLQRMKPDDAIILRLRKQPFKTHYTPNYKLDWGKKYPKATYPTRVKQEVHIFDIKEFVKNQKKKKLLDMMNAADEEENKLDDSNVASEDINVLDAPLPKEIPSNTTITDFDYSSPTNESTSTNNSMPISEIGEDDDFDVDELVRKIDAKIAELEQEEKDEKSSGNINTNNETVPTTNVVEENIPDTNYEILSSEEEPAASAPTTVAVNNSNLTVDDNDDKDDDEFFDDFFDN